LAKQCINLPANFDFTHINQLPKLSKVRKWRNISDHFTLF